MTLNEASERFHIGAETLKEYKTNGLLGHTVSEGEPLEFNEADIRRIGLIGFLQKSGMDRDSLKGYLRLLDGKTESRDEQIRILRKQRCKLLEEIHYKQQILDELDYMILETKKN